MDDREHRRAGERDSFVPRAERPNTPGASLASRVLVAVYPNGKHPHGVDADGIGYASARRWLLSDLTDLEPLRAFDLAALRAELQPAELARARRRLEPGGHSPLEVVSLGDALSREWPGDAHMVGYVLHTPDGMPLARQPRVNHGALSLLCAHGFRLRFEVVFAEADRGDKKTAPWSADAMQRAADVLNAAPELEGMAWHFTRGGVHVLGVLETPTDSPDDFEKMLRWTRERIAPALARIPTPRTPEHPQPHLVPDETVKDWTRLFRLPLVVRDGVRQSWAADLSRLAPLSPVIDSAPLSPSKRRGPRRPGVLGSFTSARAVCPIEWASLVPAVAEAMRDDQSNWNNMFLYVAGALCESGVALDDVPAIVRALSAATGRDDTDRFETCGVATARKASSGEPYAGMRSLEEHSPAVAHALARALATWAKSATRGLPTVDEARAKLLSFYASPLYGAAVAAPGTGIGKSHGALVEAQRRAQGGYTAQGQAQPNTKTGIATPTTALARELFEKARAMGIPAARLFSPVALEVDGRAVCRVEPIARAVARAGLSVFRELCDGRGKAPCVHRDATAWCGALSNTKESPVRPPRRVRRGPGLRAGQLRRPRARDAGDRPASVDREHR